jgi:hypothetical protein
MIFVHEDYMLLQCADVKVGLVAILDKAAELISFNDILMNIFMLLQVTRR